MPFHSRHAVALALFVATSALAQPQPPALPPVPVPAQNPITEAKRILGKVLFWDEQLSSDNTVACATCHSFSQGGIDARRVRTPGLDNLPNTPDDVFGSPGVINADSSDDYERSPDFDLNPQVTGRSSMSFITAAFAPQTFWDGRASNTFLDPLTNQVLIPTGGALESQAVGPIVNTIEMAHQNRDWSAVATKLASSRPLAIARNLQSDVATALATHPTYPALFANAFNDAAITPARIAMAIATYERTLYPDDTPWDRFRDGDTNALTPQQRQGVGAFATSGCAACHPAPQFTGNGFRNIGLRPNAEDLGLQNTTNNPADRGKFKVPSLRNVGLRTSLMHNGQFTNLTQVIQFYARAPGAAPQFQNNQDPLMQQVNVPPQVAPAIQDFLQNGLTDARVRDGIFPFDSASLWSERPQERVQILAGGTAGTGGIPTIIAATPPFVGNSDFKIGLSGALPGATARLLISTKPPIAGIIDADDTLGSITLPATGDNAGVGTVHWPIAPNGRLLGTEYFFQWEIEDPGATAGLARSAPARAVLFCGDLGCPPACVADMDNGSGAGIPDGGTTIDDLLYFLGAFSAGTTIADIDNGTTTGTPDGGVTIDDLLYYLGSFSTGC
ncbi:MAG: hypothetical protein IPK69_09515 [Phycisphaerales bacterium]|nr:MAG: hypothetical protein IPK69_09515 [Phycisphaerales bacterium]